MAAEGVWPAVNLSLLRGFQLPRGAGPKRVVAVGLHHHHHQHHHHHHHQHHHHQQLLLPRRSVPQQQSEFAHVEVCQSQPESTTSSAQKQVKDSGEVQRIEESLPLAYKTREQKAVNNNFPFSSHDNRHCLQNVGEYFDSGMGRKKPPPEKRQQNSHNFFLWGHEPVPSREDGLTVYQTSFVKGQSIEQPFRRRYPKHHSEKWCTGKPVPGNEENLQPKKLS